MKIISIPTLGESARERRWRGEVELPETAVREDYSRDGGALQEWIMIGLSSSKLRHSRSFGYEIKAMEGAA